MFDESKHPRAPKGSAEGGRFTSSDGAGGTHEATEAEKRRMNELGISESNEEYKQTEEDKKNTLTKNVVKVDVDSEIQKQLNEAKTPKERQKIAYRYIMDNLCGRYVAPDGRMVTISSVGADKITHKDIDVKLRVSPHLAEFIKAGKLESIKDVEHKRFAKFAYYKVAFLLGQDKYVAILNVGIRADGTSTLYDINPFNKQ